MEPGMSITENKMRETERISLGSIEGVFKNSNSSSNSKRDAEQRGVVNVPF